MKKLFKTSMIFWSFSLAVSVSQAAITPVPAGPSQKYFVQDGCFDSQSPAGLAVQICTHKSSDDTNAVVYFFHGLGGSASEAFDAGWVDMLNQFMTQRGLKTPHVVAISYGAAAIIATDAKIGPNTPNAQDFFTLATNFVEADMGIQNPKRMLLGMSLGGMNAFSVGAMKPSFSSSIAALCPALVDFNPFSDTEYAAYVQRNSAVVDTNATDNARALVRQRFGNYSNWLTTDPLTSLKNGAYSASHVLLSTGRQDQYGFFEGATAFYQNSPNQVASLNWAPVDGQHCMFDVQQLGEFLAAEFAE